MLAVLKIGAANVALSPSHPPDRLRWLIDDVDAEFILFSETYQSLAQDISPGGCFRVGPSMLIGDVLQGEKGAQNITPDDVSFLLFTGGSTGKPKAIMIDHVAFYSSIKGHGGILCYHQGSRNLQFTAYTSDVSINEIFTSLSHSVTTYIPSDHERINDLAGAMERVRVDWAFLTPSVASLLDPNYVPTLKTLLFSGESATHADTPSIQEILGVDRAHGLIYRQLLLRSTLVSEVGGQRYLLLTLHHSIYDAWSLTRLFSLLESAYERLATPPEWTKHMAGACSEVGFNQVVKSIMEQDQAKALDFWARFLKGVETKALVPPEKKCEANTILRHKMMLPRTPESGTTGNNRAGAPPRVTHAVMTYAAVALTLHNQRQAQDTVLRLVSTSRVTTAMPDIEDLVGPTRWQPARVLGPRTGTGTTRHALRAGFDEASGVHAEAERACHRAPQIIVHPHDSYTEQPAAGLGLRRRELSALNDDDSIPFTMDISLQVQGKTLKALDLHVVFESNLIPEHDVRRLVAELVVITRRISSATSGGSGNPATLTDIVPAEEDSFMIMDLERHMTVAQNERWARQIFSR
ncbi:hypothetical protein BGZ61DRAFT_514500 [Ilyonectria robusta]|uniref:uncharacterized protein n=1 Tax=Ilyonectria robusta TaxID=1079257 RepID=UPI001E8CE70C|nr:uncharacterized protein BGZ61DRAFT_514500 [Ilyonectria robusta]KAH8735228.1 hypothetical protein BGZ61DRAFT_514500 [Ilyonectria robusta]